MAARGYAHAIIAFTFSDVPGIEGRLEQRLNQAGIKTMQDLLAIDAKHMRKLWGNVNGERMHYALHGYDIHAMPTARGMYGHARVLPPSWQDMSHAREVSRLLLTKAARRMRRDGFYANRVWIWLDMRKANWFGETELYSANDDQACLVALSRLWKKHKGK